MKIYSLEQLKEEMFTEKERLQYEKELKEKMTLKKGMRVLIKNRTVWEQGTILRKYRRKEVIFFNIQTERGSILENITFDETKPCYIDELKSLKLNQNADTKI